MTTTTNSQRGRHSGVQQAYKRKYGRDGRVGDERIWETDRVTREKERDREKEEVREGGTRGRDVARRGGESTNEETNAPRSKEHACGSARECCKEGTETG